MFFHPQCYNLLWLSQLSRKVQHPTQPGMLAAAGGREVTERGPGCSMVFPDSPAQRPYEMRSHIETAERVERGPG